MTNHPADLALVGAGYWGKNLARNFHALGALHTLCDVNAPLLAGYGTDYAEVRRTADYAEVLADQAITRVAIAAPAVYHHKLAKAALEAGKDVYVEKPLCLEARDAAELVALADRLGRVLMVGHLLQYHPCVSRLQSLVAQGELGKIHYITSNRLNLGKIRREENALWSFAPHDISVILSLTGNHLPEQLRCSGGAYLNSGVADSTMTTLRFAGGVRAHIFVSWLNPFKEQKLTVVGSGGMVVFDDTLPWAEKLVLHRQYLTWANGQDPVAKKGTGTAIEVPQSEPLREECAHFLACCANRQAPRTDGHEGLRVLQVLQMAQKSLEQDGEAITPSRRRSAGQQSTPYSRHPSAVVDDGAIIGEGTKIWHFSHIMAGASIGRNCIFGQNCNVDGGVRIGNNVKVQNNVSIYTGTEIEDDVFLGPSCVLTNVTNPRAQIRRHALYEKTLIRRGATVGANATIVCGTTIGRYAFIAAGAVVHSDVPDYALMLGVPARQKGWMSRHGHPLQDPDERGVMVCPESGMRYREESKGVLRCLDLGEETPLPQTMAVGEVGYAEVKQVGAVSFA